MMTGAAVHREDGGSPYWASQVSEETIRGIVRLDTFGGKPGRPTPVTGSEWLFPDDQLPQRFGELAASWHEECCYLSSVREMALHPAYQQIIGMGPAVLPYLLDELEREPDHWFWALEAITGEDPVRPEHQGLIHEMAQDWLRWAKGQGWR